MQTRVHGGFTPAGTGLMGCFAGILRRHVITRNEGVRGSNPRVGSPEAAGNSGPSRDMPVASDLRGV